MRKSSRRQAMQAGLPRHQPHLALRHRRQRAAGNVVTGRAPQPAEQAEQHQVQATPSSAKEAEVAETEEELEEDAEDPRQKRERAWLRHKRQAMEAAATQEDDLFAPRPKKRIRSILMAGIA
ncbi:unnamed protein product [Effrenium voratum]|nr:unnamed protein product [Effrenium voratum]